MREYIDVPAASLAAVQRTLSGHMVLVDEDVQGIAKQLSEIDPALRLFYSPDEQIWVVCQHVGDEEKLVTSTTELDGRLVHRVRRICSSGYDLAAEIEKAELEAERDNDYKRLERVGPAAERLAHALRKDLGHDQGRVFLNGRRDG